MIRGDARTNIRVAQACIGVTQRDPAAPDIDATNAAQILMFAAVLVIRSNHLMVDLSEMARECDNYLASQRADIATAKRLRLS